MNFGKIGQILLTVLCLYVISAICSFVQGYLMTGVSQKTTYRLRREISEKINRMPMSYFDTKPVGEVLSRVTNANPKIANYHFTTLSPNLGVVDLDGGGFVIADIPGLIEGASDGVGLGHAFLRHVERCRLILHVVDVSGSEGRDPIADYETIQQELERFNADLAARPQMVAANKCDMATEEQIAAFRNYIEQEKGLPFFCISAATTQGTKELVQAIGAKLTELPPILQYEPEPLSAEELAETTEKGTFEIEVEDGVYYIDAKFLEPILRTVNLDDYSSLQYFQKVLRSSGIIDKLEEMGIQEGDTVNLYGFEFDFVS